MLSNYFFRFVFLNPPLLLLRSSHTQEMKSQNPCKKSLTMKLCKKGSAALSDGAFEMHALGGHHFLLSSALALQEVAA